jgi:hypothetical protein
MSTDAEIARIRRSAETPEQREKRLAYQREYAKRRRAQETPEQRDERLAYQRAANRKHRHGRQT